MNPTVRSILVPTDFSDDAALAMLHGLRIAVAFRASLDVLHVEPQNDTADWHWSPDAIRALQRWGQLPAVAGPKELAALGIAARRSTATGLAADEAIFRELAAAHADLVILASHGRTGVDRWLQPSVTAPVARQAASLTLLLPRAHPGFVDADTGLVTLRRILVAVDHRPHPAPAYEAAWLFGRNLGPPELEMATLHVGTEHPETDLQRVEPGWRSFHWTEAGNPVDRIAHVAREWGADLVVAATEGRTHWLDGLRGSTVERLIDHLPAPLLVVPADWGEAPE
jgi:nucleotide-binding universal stress UspA family protein